MLDFIDGDTSVGSDHAEGKDAVRGWSTEDGFDEGHQANLLTEERKVILEDWLMIDGVFVNSKFVCVDGEKNLLLGIGKEQESRTWQCRRR